MKKKPKKAREPREWWLWKDPDGRASALCDHEGRAKEYAMHYGYGEVIHLREVPKRRRK